VPCFCQLNHPIQSFYSTVRIVGKAHHPLPTYHALVVCSPVKIIRSCYQTAAWTGNRSSSLALPFHPGQFRSRRGRQTANIITSLPQYAPYECHYCPPAPTPCPGSCSYSLSWLLLLLLVPAPAPAPCPGSCSYSLSWLLLDRSNEGFDRQISLDNLPLTTINLRACPPTPTSQSVPVLPPPPPNRRILPLRSSCLPSHHASEAQVCIQPHPDS
jgi:hypothetical protein